MGKKINAQRTLFSLPSPRSPLPIHTTHTYLFRVSQLTKLLHKLRQRKEFLWFDKVEQSPELLRVVLERCACEDKLINKQIKKKKKSINKQINK